MILALPRVALALCFAVPLFAAPAPLREVKRGWDDLLQLDANPARQAFVAAQTIRPADRPARLGQALALFAAQPRTADNLARAGRILTALREENADDDAGISAAYYSARLIQLHNPEPDRAAAVAAYRALLAAHPTHPCAQLAAPKLAILLLYDEVPPVEWERRAAECETLLAHATAPETIRDLRLVLADAYARLRNDPRRSLACLAPCLAESTPIRPAHLEALLIQAAESARMLGHKADAIAYFEHYLAEYPRNVKADEIRRRIADLGAGGTGDPR